MIEIAAQSAEGPQRSYTRAARAHLVSGLARVTVLAVLRLVTYSYLIGLQGKLIGQCI